MGELELKVKIANQILDAYPTDNYVYEVSYCGKKNSFKMLMMRSSQICF